MILILFWPDTLFKDLALKWYLVILRIVTKYKAGPLVHQTSDGLSKNHNVTHIDKRDNVT